MKKWLTLAACALVLLAQIRTDEAAKLFRERKFQECAALLEERLRSEPNDFAAYMLLGLSRQALGQLDKAEVAFLGAIRVQPRNATAYYSLGRVRFMLGRFDEALLAAAEAQRLGEPAARVHHLRARIEEERGRLSEALAEYSRAISAEQKMVEALAGQASVLYKLARYAEARKSAEAALRLDPDNAEAARISKQAARIASAPVAEPATSVRLVRKEFTQFRLDHFAAKEKYLISTMAGGLAVFDFDDDGRQDLFFANGAEIPSLKKTGPRFWNRLYRNAGDWRFEDVTEAAGVQGQGFAMGAAAADFDRDGRIDLFVPGLPRNLLYRNTSGRFVEISKHAGIRDEVWSVAAAWIDYNRDGWLDLFVVNYVDWKPEDDRYCGDKAKGIRVYCHPREYRGLANRLYRNRGDGTFEDVSQSSGIAQHTGKGMSAAVIDADNDGWPDLFVTNDTQPNFLFHNRGDGTFQEAAVAFGAALNETGNAISAMGVDARDYDNDGLTDLAITALAGENFLLLRNTGKKSFEDMTYPSRLGVTASRRSGWGVAFADLNNDGWKDLVTANSHVTDNVEQIRNERYREPNTVFVNRGGTFEKAQEFGPEAAHRGLAVADLDNDGRLDVAVTVLGDTPELWRNETAAGNWLRLKVDRPGTRVRLGSQWQVWSPASGYASSNLDAIHFGLGATTEAADIEVFWPDGGTKVLRNVKSGQVLDLRNRLPGESK